MCALLCCCYGQCGCFCWGHKNQCWYYVTFCKCRNLCYRMKQSGINQFHGAHAYEPKYHQSIYKEMSMLFVRLCRSSSQSVCPCSNFWSLQIYTYTHTRKLFIRSLLFVCCLFSHQNKRLLHFDKHLIWSNCFWFEPFSLAMFSVGSVAGWQYSLAQSG